MRKNMLCFLAVALLVGVTAAQNRSQSDPASQTGAEPDAKACNSTLLGDVNGDGKVTDADASMILSWLAGKIAALNCPANADADQDGVITSNDATVIKERVAGTSRSLIVGLEGGLPGKVYLGAAIEISAQEVFFPFYVQSGTARIQSPSTGYDSGDQSMFFQPGGRSLYWQWQTLGLPEASDYQVSVTLYQPGPLPPLTGKNAEPLTYTASLTLRPYEPKQLSRSVDAAAPSPGIPLSFVRSWTHDSYSTPAPGSLGLGWRHSFDIQLYEYTDGSVAFIAPDGVNQIFTPDGGGTYTAPPGDYNVLTLVNGLFQLREKNGFVYNFGLYSSGPNFLLNSVQDRNGNSITCGYDGQGRLISLQHSSGSAFQLQYNSLGFISVLTDQIGHQTQYSYDASGTHLASVTLPDGSVTSYSYISGAGVETNDRLQTVTFPDGTHLYFAYDSTGQFASSQLDGGASKLAYSYPADGKTTIMDAVHGVTSILVNDGLLPVQIVDPLGNVTTYQYDASFDLIGTTDPLGRTRTFSYDSRGNVTQTVDPAGNQLLLTYDPAFSQLTSFQDSRGNQTTFALDGNGNVTSEVYPNGTSESYAYSESGLPSSSTDAKGQVISYTYTPFGQLQTVTYPDNSSANYAYDGEGNLTSATNSTGTITLTYDTGNRLLSKTYPGSRTLQYKYNSGGQRIQMTNADGQSTDYTFDSAGRLSQVLNSTGQAVVSYQYDAVGRVSKKTLANGAHTGFAYDLASRVQSITTKASSGKAISFFDYTYDADGDILSKKAVEGLEQYTYDVLGQLTGVTYPNGTPAQYSYDSAGNRISSTEAGVQSAYVTNNQNEYQSVGAETYTYDANGNTTGQSPSEPNIPYAYSYDFNNRLTQAQTSSEAVSYTYNALGERSTRTDPSGTVQYLWDGLELATEQTPALQTIANYTWGRALDETVAMTRNGSSYYYTQDALLSVSDLLNSSGTAAEHYTYSAFGTPSQISNIGNPFLFTGARYDAAISQYSFRARWFFPALGRFVTSDPIGLAGGSNVYSYAGNAPPVYKDPGGLASGALGYLTAFAVKASDVNGAVDFYSNVGQHFFSTVFGFLFADAAGKAAEGAILNALTPTYLGIEAGACVVAPGCAEVAALGGAVAGGLVGLANLDFIDDLFEFPLNGYAFPGESGGGGTSNGGSTGSGTSPGGGQCPTFIQIGQKSIHANAIEAVNKNLFGRIAVPLDNALIRSDIPIFGIAGGTDFKQYRVEYGEGRNPTKWTLIESSTTPQPTNTAGLDIHLMQGDLDLQGNLANWNTGLKEWEYLPWHPADDPTDLRGEYTVRLVVTGKDGKSTEDRVNVEVGRVISQVLPGDAISTDNKVTMHFEPQSLQAPFRVYTIKPLVKGVPSIPNGMELVGSPYTIREPGDKFLKPVVLRFDVTGKTSGLDLPEFGIYAYDAKTHQWEPLPTLQGGQSNTLETSIYELPDPVAYFAVMHGPGSASLPSTPKTVISAKAKVGNDNPILILDTFETDLGQWAARDRAFGGTVEREKTATPDGTYSLKITNQNAGGDFAITAVSTPFRADVYPMVSFDYRIEPGVKTDFYVRIGQMWYRIGFTGEEDERKFRNAEVGVSPIGRIEGVVTDGQWHTASFDLNRLLATKTARRNVEEIVMADWRVGGLMKLEFGDNPRGAFFNIDNFKIRRGEEIAGIGRDGSLPLVIDDFAGTAQFNSLGGVSDVFSNPGTQNVVMTRVIAEDRSRTRQGQTLSLRSGAARAGVSGGYPSTQNVAMTSVVAHDASQGRLEQALSLKYDVTQIGAYGGYWTQLRGAPGDSFDQIVLRVKALDKWTRFLVGLKRKDGIETKVPAERYWGPVDADGWRTVTVPLAAFGSPNELSALDVFSISFTNASGHGKGELLLDDVRLERGLSSVLIADFDDDTNTNRLMQKNWVFTSGAAAVSFGPQRPDSESSSQALRISYGGTIGLDLGRNEYSYAGWVAGLGGIDASHAQSLQFRVRGQAGGERFDVYLDDGTRRKPADIGKYVAITKDWKDVSVPLEVFARQGVDLSHLEELQLVFEWQQMSGTVYIDDIRLTQSELALK